MPIHATAIISPKSEIDPTAQIGAYVVIDDEVTVGANTRILPHAYLCGYTTIGENNEIFSTAVLGERPQDVAFKGEKSYLVIGDDNIIREGVTIHRATGEGATTNVGNGCFLMGNTHIAHNCRIGNGVITANGAGIAGFVEIGDRAFVSACALIHQFTRIGRLCMIAGGTRLGMDVAPFLMAIGESEVVNINLVGLRRAGFASQEIKDVRSAYKLLYRCGKPFGKAVEELAASEPSPLVQEMLDFINADSKRGTAGSPKRVKE